MKLKLLYVFLLCSALFSAQVGINTTNPDPSAAIDVRSGAIPMGMLTPRVTSAERSVIGTRPTPLAADGLIVYDIDVKAFFHWSSSTNSWVKINSGIEGRTNFKRIKSTDVLATVLAAELAAGGGSTYKLTTNTLYEINGTVTLNFPIDLNNSYLQGIDSGDDRLVSGGNIFDGSTGGTVKGLTLSSTGGKVFNLTGTAAQNLFWRDCIVVNSANVGTISNFGLVFLSIVQFSGNTTGISYSNISQLLLSNLGWFGNNTGTFEKLSGTFGLVQKQGGFSEVNGAAIGFDVSSNPIMQNGVLTGVAFNGSNTAEYVNAYPLANRYVGYNFSNSWTVDSPGIPREADGDATGDINLDAAVGVGAQTSFTGTNGAGTRTKVSGTTTSNNLFRFTKDGNNRITYRGNKPRYFQVAGSVSYQGGADFTVILYIAKNGTVLTDTKVYGRGTTGFLTTQGIIALPVVGTVQLKKDDYIEIWAERFDGSGNMQTVSLNLTAR